VRALEQTIGCRLVHRSAVVLALSLLAIAARPHDSRAQQDAAPRVPRTLAGTWVSATDSERAMRTVVAAFESTVRTLPELLRGFARDRVRSEMAPPNRVVVALNGERVRVTLESGRTSVIAGPLGAHATTSGIADGTVVTPRLEGGWLELRYEGENSVLRQLYSTEPDGSSMHLDYTVSGERVPRTVRYRLEFVRRPDPR
jgi:hypothetical protein